MPRVKEDIDFKLIFKESSDFYSIKLLKGKYKDVIYTYGKVGVGKETGSGKLPLKFVWKLEEKPKNITEDLNKSKEFTTYIGDVLADLIIESKILNAREYPNNNTKDSSPK